MKTEQELDRLVLEAFQQKHPSQIGDEIRRLVSLLNRLDIHTVLEIGSEEGGTVKLWTKLFDDLDLICIDANTYSGVKGKQQELEALWKSWCSNKQTVNVIWGNSHDPEVIVKLLTLGQSRDSQGADMLFIDGDHSEEGVELDYQMYKGYVKPGGVIVVADIHPIERIDMTCWKWWRRFIQKPINQSVDRTYHVGARPNYIEIFHDYENQKAFGFGVVFV